MAWGVNAFGQLGRGVTGPPQKFPLQVTNLTGVVSVTAGAWHSLALKSDGTVAGWGWNRYGQVGRGVFSFIEPTPVGVTNLNGALSLAAGAVHSLAMLSDGTVAAWGFGWFGQAGGAVAIYSVKPSPVGYSPPSKLRPITKRTAQQALNCW